MYLMYLLVVTIIHQPMRAQYGQKLTNHSGGNWSSRNDQMSVWQCDTFLTIYLFIQGWGGGGGWQTHPFFRSWPTVISASCWLQTVILRQYWLLIGQMKLYSCFIGGWKIELLFILIVTSHSLCSWSEEILQEFCNICA